MRLVTRADFDGLVCGSLITATEKIESYLFVEPKFMQDGMVEIRTGDIIANLPYHPKCSLWFDHHVSNQPPDFDRPLVPGRGGFRLAPSAARVVYEYYTEVPGTSSDTLELLRTERIRRLVDETDKIDAALLSPEEVLHPQGYLLISLTLDGKRPEDEPYWVRLIALLRDQPPEAILKDPEIEKRCERVLGAQRRLRQTLLERGSLKGNVIFVDLRGIQDPTDDNRYLLYTLFPQGNISLKVADDPQRPNAISISVGYNIFNSTATVNVGKLLQKFGGGGHKVVGSCRVANEEADRAIREIMNAIRET